MTSVSFLSLNLWNLNEPLQTRLDIVGDFILSNDIDVVLFQEVPVRDHRPIMPGILRDRGYTSHFYSTGYWSRREEGLAICTRKHSVLVGAVPLQRTELENHRGALAVRVLLGGAGDFLAVTSHLSFRAEDAPIRTAQANQIVALLDELWVRLGRLPTVLCADLNCTADERAFATLLQPFGDEKFRDIQAEAGLGATYTFERTNPYVADELRPDRRIDYALATSTWKLGSFELVFNSQQSGYASDHSGLSFTLVAD